MKIIDIDILSAFFYNENSKKRKGGFLWNPFYYPHAVLQTPQLCSGISRKMPLPTQYPRTHQPYFPLSFFHEFSAFPSASSTAFRIPVELKVAPDTVSTSVLYLHGAESM